MDGIKRWQDNLVGLITDEMLNRITCPVLTLVGQDEGEMMMQQAKEFYKKVNSKNKILHVFTMEQDACIDHCQLDHISRGNQLIFDWLEGLFR